MRCSSVLTSFSCVIASTLNQILTGRCARGPFSCLRGFALMLALLTVVLFSSCPARAQTAHLAGIALAGNLATPTNGAYGFTTDSSGNIYVADAPNNRIVVIPPGDLTCATSCTIVTLTNLVAGEHATRLTVDSSGNMYVVTQDSSSDFGHIY
jgi:DNA-binding beta-propeller fold protein YncE